MPLVFFEIQEEALVALRDTAQGVPERRQRVATPLRIAGMTLKLSDYGGLQTGHGGAVVHCLRCLVDEANTCFAQLGRLGAPLDCLVDRIEASVNILRVTLNAILLPLNQTSTSRE